MQCCSVHLDENCIKDVNDRSFLPFLNFPPQKFSFLQQRAGMGNKCHHRQWEFQLGLRRSQCESKRDPLQQDALRGKRPT